MRATFVFPNPRAELLAAVASGKAPDSTLLGSNHLAAQGIEARVHDPLLSRLHLRAPFDRVAWNLRELILPAEVGRTDVVFTPLASVLPLAARARMLPVVVVNYGLNLIWRRSSSRRRLLLGASLRAAAKVVCLGESQRKELVEAVGIPAADVLTLLLPIDAEFFSPSVDSEGSDGVLTVGKDLARDFDTFLAAVGSLDVPVQIAAYTRNLEGLALPSNARATQLAPLQLREAYARSRVVVLPQRRDSYPFGSEGGGLTALLEAMAMAKPIVATDRAILRDYVDDEVEALIVPAEDPWALRAAIERVLGDAELAQRLGTAARARVESGHTTSAFAAQLAPVLRGVV